VRGSFGASIELRRRALFDDAGLRPSNYAISGVRDLALRTGFFVCKQSACFLAFFATRRIRSSTSADPLWIQAQMSVRQIASGLQCQRPLPRPIPTLLLLAPDRARIAVSFLG